MKKSIREETDNELYFAQLLRPENRVFVRIARNLAEIADRLVPDHYELDVPKGEIESFQNKIQNKIQNDTAPHIKPSEIKFKKYYRQGMWDVFDLITSVSYGKQRFFLQDNWTVYDREDGEYYSFDEAFDKYLSEIGDNGDY